MKGDLSTLKKVCLYGSKVMFAGTAVLSAIIGALMVLGAGSLFSDGMREFLGGFIGSDFTDGTDAEAVSAYLIMLLIFALAVITVFTTYQVMVSIYTEHSPFTETNTSRIKMVSKSYLVCAVAFLVLEAAGGNGLAVISFMFFGCVLIAVVLYMFALIVRYGALLQDESDHTL